jgi:hypothetical protein
MPKEAEKVPNPLTERVGVNAVEAITNNVFGWFFREQPIGDYGVDAHIEEMVNGRPTGKLIALQIKTGKSYFRPQGDDFVFYGAKRHLIPHMERAPPTATAAMIRSSDELLRKTNAPIEAVKNTAARESPNEYTRLVRSMRPRKWRPIFQKYPMLKMDKRAMAANEIADAYLLTVSSTAVSPICWMRPRS